MKKLFFCFIAFILLLPTISFSQGVGISYNMITPHPSAMLEIQATDRGILIPRVALQSTTLSTPITNPAISLLVYNTATVNDVFPGYYYWDGSQWIRLATGSLAAGVTSISAGVSGVETGTSGLTFSVNPITASGTIALSNTGVTPGTYGNTGANVPNITVDSRGRLTAASNRALTPSDIGAAPATHTHATLTFNNSGSGATSGSTYNASSALTVSYNTIGAVGGSGEATRIAFWNSTNTLSSNANLFWDNTNNRLGIGTATPTARLHVNGPIRLQGLTSTTTETTALIVDANGNVYTRGLHSVAFTGTVTETDPTAWKLSGNTATVSDFLGTTNAVDLRIFTNNTERMRISSGGNVGIGTTSPTARLHVDGTVRFVNLAAPAGETTALVVDANGNVKARTLNTVAFNGYTETDPGAWRLTGNAASASDFIGTTNAIDFRVFTNNSERMRVTSTGRIGINTTTPSTLLHVAGSNQIAIRGEYNANSYGIIGTQFDGIYAYSNVIDGYGLKAEGGPNAAGGIWAQGANGKLSGYFGGMAQFYTEYTGQFAIQAIRNTLTSNTDLSSVIELIRKTSATTMGTTMGVGLLFSLEYGTTATKEYMGAIYAQRNGADNQGRLIFSTRSGGTLPVERMTILHNGNVGIGTSSPWARLNVNNGRLVVEYEDDFVHPGAHYYHRNPWLYLWRKEYPVDVRQGGHIIFAASMDNAGTPADLCMIEGVRENNISPSTASYLAFYTRPHSGDWLERLRINSNGFFHFQPSTASGATIWLNADGTGSSGSEPTLVPSSNLYGFVGTTTRYWYRMYAGQFNTPSSSKFKTNIQPIEQNFYAEAYNIVRNLNMYSYNYVKTLYDEENNIISQTIEERRRFGILTEEAPEIILDESKTAIELASYIQLLASALKETQIRLEEAQKRLQELENLIQQYQNNK